MDIQGNSLEIFHYQVTGLGLNFQNNIILLRDYILSLPYNI